jgi:membrane protease YdiL (CAAX protease family)
MLGPLIAGSLGEELGWRGFAQPVLQQRYRAVHASIIIGVLWATWHEWGALAPGGPARVTTVDLTQTFVRLISTAIVYGWLFNTTRGSLPVVMVAHAAHNIAVDLMPVPLGGPGDVSLIVAGLYLVAGIAVITMTPTRNRLAGGHAIDSTRAATPEAERGHGGEMGELTSRNALPGGHNWPMPRG